MIFDANGRFHWVKMSPGDRVWIRTLNFNMNHEYVFEREQDGKEKRMRLIVELSKLPDDFGQYIRANRNAQEVLCNADIEMDEMQVYLHFSERILNLGLPFRLFATAPCAEWHQGDVYHTNAAINKAYFISPKQQPDVALNSERRSA